MFRVEIHSERVNVKEGKSARTGNDYMIREQQAFIYLNGEPYPTKFKLQLSRDQAPYPKGEYALTPEFFVGQYGDLRLGMRDAVVEQAAQKKAVNA